MKGRFILFFAGFLAISHVSHAETVPARAMSMRPRTETRAIPTPATNERIPASRASVAPSVSRVAAPSASRIVSARAASSINARPVAAARGGTPSTVTARAAALNRGPAVTVARAGIAPNSATMGSEYNSCRDAYFTCMDQFCAVKDETYRRCVCSNRLPEMRALEESLSQTQQSLTDFGMYNIDAISKTASEVKSMSAATAGEAAMKKDSSSSAVALAEISAVLGSAKSSSGISSSFGRDLGSIWGQSDIIGSADVAMLEGEKLYAQMNSQCSKMVSDVCGSADTLKMVVSAYGMFIENDCNVLAASLNNKKTGAAASIRQTERQMSVARLENYDAHNSDAINECLKNVRTEMTQEGACGPDFVACLDITGKYLNSVTGDPIYTPSFWQLKDQIELSSNVLVSRRNKALLQFLEKKKPSARVSLGKCQDISKDVWEEFLRQAVVEIHQRQQEKILAVREECIDVVNMCYDTTRGQLQDFANIEADRLLGFQTEATEAICRQKLETCNNVYVYDNESNREDLLTEYMKTVSTTEITDECERILTNFVNNICGTKREPYPYACRTFDAGGFEVCRDYVAPISREIKTEGSGDSEKIIIDVKCKDTVYQRIAAYARENCARPSIPSSTPIPEVTMHAINKVFDKVQNDMREVLSVRCKDAHGFWNEAVDNIRFKSAAMSSAYYKLTRASNTWGNCDSEHFCNYPNDYIIIGGQKTCCDFGQVANKDGTACVQLCIENSEGACDQSDGVVFCPVNSSLAVDCVPGDDGKFKDSDGNKYDTMTVKHGSDLKAIAGGCVSSTCRCNTGYFNMADGRCRAEGQITMLRQYKEVFDLECLKQSYSQTPLANRCIGQLLICKRGKPCCNVYDVPEGQVSNLYPGVVRQCCCGLSPVGGKKWYWGGAGCVLSDDEEDQGGFDGYVNMGGYCEKCPGYSGPTWDYCYKENTQAQFDTQLCNGVGCVSYAAGDYNFAYRKKASVPLGERTVYVPNVFCAANLNSDAYGRFRYTYEDCCSSHSGTTCITWNDDCRKRNCNKYSQEKVVGRLDGFSDYLDCSGVGSYKSSPNMTCSSARDPDPGCNWTRCKCASGFIACPRDNTIAPAGWGPDYHRCCRNSTCPAPNAGNTTSTNNGNTTCRID